MRATRLITITTLVAALGTIGCEGGPPLAEVEGTVKVNGQPLDNIQVEFWPISSGPKSIGVTDAQGRYSLTTDTNRKGAVVGSHKVVLKDVGIMGDKFLGRAGEDVDMTKGRKSRVPAVFGEVGKTTIEKSVVAGAKNEIDITP